MRPTGREGRATLGTQHPVTMAFFLFFFIFIFFMESHENGRKCKKKMKCREVKNGPKMGQNDQKMAQNDPNMAQQSR